MLPGKKGYLINLKQLTLCGVAFFIIALIAAENSAAEGDILSLKDYEYWSNGKVKQCTMYDPNGRLKAKGFYRYDGSIDKIERYDEYSNRIEEVLYDPIGKLRVGIDGWAARRWWYDGNSLVAEISYDESGRSIERRQYSESGKLILRQYWDTNKINPYENAAMYVLLGARNMRFYDPAREMGDDAVF